MAGSFRFKFMATALRRLSAVRPEIGEERLAGELGLFKAEIEERRFRSRAFIVAAAARETEDERGEGEGVRRRWEGGCGGEGEAG